LNYENSVAIRVTIFKEKVAAQLRLVASEKIYSKSGEINDLEEEIILSGKDVSLTFTESPDFKVGDRLKGKIEVEYEPYYQIDSSNILSKIVPEFKLIFDKEILGL
jgi:hypothetical protein